MDTTRPEAGDLSTSEAAERLGVTPEHIRSEWKAGRLAGRVVGGSLRVHLPDLDRDEHGGGEALRPLLSVTEAASLLRVPEATVRRMAQDGQLPTLWSGSRPYIIRAATERLMAGEVSPPGRPATEEAA